MSQVKNDAYTVCIFENYITYFYHIGLMPKYDFKTKKIMNNRLSKIRFLLQFVLFTIGQLYFLEARITFYFRHQHSRQIASDIFFVSLISLTNILGICIYATSIKMSMLKADSWENVFDEILKVESLNKNSLNVASKVTWKCTMLNFAFHIFIIIFLICLVIEAFNDIDYLLSTVNYFFSFYISFVILEIEANLIICIKSKYHLLSAYLLNYKTLPIFQISKIITEIRDVFDTLNHIVININEIFDVNNNLIFLLFAAETLKIFFWANAFEHTVEKTIEPSYMRRSLLIIRLRVTFKFILILSGILLTTFCCDLAVKDSQKIATNCQRLMQQFPANSQEYLELQNLADHVIQNKPVFTAAACFEINRSTVFSIITNCGTYFIVLIQFFNEWPM